MKSVWERTARLGCLAWLGMATSALAAPITYTASFTIKLATGADIAGLNGANIVFTANFADGATWQTIPVATGYRAFVQAAVTTVQISGASNDVSNGLRTTEYPTGLGFGTGLNDVWISGPDSGALPSVGPMGGGQPFYLKISLAHTPATPLPVIGGYLSTSQFGSFVLDPMGTSFSNPNHSAYSLDLSKPVTVSLTGGPATPEPVAIGIVGVGFAVLQRRYRKA